MRKQTLLLLTLFLLAINCTAQTSITIDYSTAVDTIKSTLDFGTDIIRITNVPAILTSPITINGSPTPIISINSSLLANPSVFANNTLTIKINNGKIGSPFPSSNVLAPLIIRFNQKIVIITKQAVPPPHQAPPLVHPITPISTLPQPQLSAGQSYNPGYIYYDVVKLIQAKNSGDTTTAKFILNYYGGIRRNAFLTENWAYLYPQTDADGGGVPFLSQAVSSVGNLNVTNIADGIAKFLIERSKQELTVSFFSNFQAFLKKYPELNVLFPTTCSFIGQINDYQYNAMLPALRTAFQQDLNNITANLINLRDLTPDKCNSGDTTCAKRLQRLNAFFKTTDGRSVLAALIVVNNIIKGNNAADAISNLAADPVCQVTTTDKFYNVAGTIQFINLLSQSLISTDNGRVWIKQQQITDLISNEIAIKTYLGLLYAKNNASGTPVQFYVNGNVVKLQSLMDTLQVKWLTVGNSFKMKFKVMANAISTISDDTQVITSATAQSDPNSILAYANYATSISSGFSQAVNFLADSTSFSSKLVTLKKDAALLDTVVTGAANIIYDVKSQNYGALVLNSSNLLTRLFQGKFTFQADFIKYGTFMANIVQAKTSDEVQAAIDATVLPVGSASIKRNTPMNISLNAYIGATAGKEFLASLPKGTQWGGVAGVTAPVGVAFSWGDKFMGKTDANGNPIPDKNGKVTGGKSLTLFVSLIDVGALAAYRLQNDGSSVAPEVQLKNIVAPGLSFYYGFGKSPISLGLGAQFGPQLRSITATDVNLQQNYYLRVAASLVVDIPLFNFYTKTK